METTALQHIASQVRRDIVRMVAGVNSGHPGGSLGCADFLTLLYFDQLHHDAENFTMDGIGQDLFFLSSKVSGFVFLILAFSNKITLLFL